MARCSEKNRSALERNLKREMRLLLTRYNIAPYQQQFDHELNDSILDDPDEVKELEQADDYVESQSESIDKLKGKFEDK